MPITIALAIVLLVRALDTIGYFAPERTGPQPHGESIVGGVVLGYDAADGADAAIAEVRGRRNFPGEVRETLYLVRAPFENDDFEALGRGGTLGEIAPDASAIAWLKSKERGHSTGPGRVRAAAKDATAIEEKALLPGLVFHPGSTTAVGLTQYQPATGRGALTLFDTATGDRRVISANVPPGGFAALDGGRTFALRRPLQAVTAEALVLPGIGVPPPPIALDIDVADPRPAFAVAPDRRSVTMRVVGADENRSLVRWREGDAAAATIATGVAAWTLDSTGAVWWVERAGESTLRVHRESAVVGDIAGSTAIRVHPLPGGAGAWVELAEKACCPSLALAGAGPAPPAIPYRHSVSPPGGWPIALLAPLESGLSLTAFSDPARPVTLEGGGVLTASFSADGRHLAAHLAGGGERVVLLSLESGASRVLSEEGDRGGNPAPLAIFSWHGNALLHVWRNREWRSDPHNGLYRVVP